MRIAASADQPATVATTVAVAKDLRVLVNSAYKMDAQALVRGRIVGARTALAPGINSSAQLDRRPEGSRDQLWADIFVTTPLGPIGMRRIRIEGLFNSEIAEHDEDGGAINSTGRHVEGMWTAQSVLEGIDAQLLSYSRSDQRSYPTTAAGEAILQLHIADAEPNRWPGALPSSVGYNYLDDVATAELTDLYKQVGTVAREEAGPLGLPPSLLNQTLLTVSATQDAAAMDPVAVSTVEIPGRVIMALGALGFMGGDYARVSASQLWIRIDTRVGTVYAPRAGKTNLLSC